MISIIGLVSLIGMLVVSVVLHELAHGWVAFRMGDSTAQQLGRLTLNPIAHIDWLGSIVLPALCALLGSPVWIAWAKPVPVNSRNLKNPENDMMWIAIAGPLTNITLAVVVGILFRIFLNTGSIVSGEIAYQLMIQFVFLNLGLAVFNLIPIPPLDGSKILMPFLSGRSRYWFSVIAPYGIGIILCISFTGVLSRLVTGIIMPIGQGLLYGI
ncbi:site-2 protease family protein [bacterium]|nr:site-2 protease family protein [bacterium]